MFLQYKNMLSDYIGEYSNYSMGYSPAGRIGVKSCDDMLWNYWYGYSTDRTGRPKNHQVRSIYDMENDETAFLQWDADGQLQDMMRPCSGDLRHHWWNEAGQLSAMVDNEHCGYYGYDANGERVYKLTGTVYADQYNAGDVNIDMYFDDMVLYVNPYMVVTPRGYTKHYYNGSQRIAARLGDYWADSGMMMDESDMMFQAREVLEDRMSDLNGNEEYFENEAYRSIYGEDFCCESHILRINNINCNYAEDMLLDVFNGGIRQSDYMSGIAEGIFYYHSDHLGSASWITDDQGGVVQYIHYMPYGEIWVNQQACQYDERFKFTGKERDTETGYDYFGARYYLSLLGIWLSPDPLMDKYPNISSYAYCKWNPLKYIDQRGDSTRLWVENAGVGHTWVTTGEGENMQVYSYGRYDDVDKTKSFLSSLSPTGEGVLLRLTGEEARAYISEKEKLTQPINVTIPDVTDIQVQCLFDDLFNSSSELPSRADKLYYNNPNAHVIDRYHLLNNNCTTKSVSVLKVAGTSFFKDAVYIPSPNGKGYCAEVNRYFISPAFLFNYIKTK